MKLSDTVECAKIYFPNLKVKYKDESWFMKLLGYILFFNKSFMTDYTTTIGSTIYFPSRAKVEAKQLSSIIVLLHELVHIYDSQKLTRLLFSFLYLIPQILAPISLLLWLISWKIALISFIVLLLPIPAYFRMYFEKRAYAVSLYVLKTLGAKCNFPPMLSTNRDYFIKQFKSSAYYYMWLFKDIDLYFNDITNKISNGQRPYEDEIFNILDDLIDHM
jgi:hypothetical protein